jgi:hypothetical protein
MLKRLAAALANPMNKLIKLILKERRWPEVWMTHWVVPLHKRNNVYSAGNYRGVHLTSQLSKAVERVLRSFFKPFLLKNVAFGENQFAYTPERGARDALAHLLITWSSAMSKGRKVAVYCSDVSGAFDRVKLCRLAAKLKAKRIHPKIIEVLVSWLRNRKARVVVGGEASEEFVLENMVFQGTVFGPDLWNVFYEDAKEAIKEMHYEECVFADDLNAYRIFPGVVSNERILTSLEACQRELHDWGNANQVIFDAGKEGHHILTSRGDSHGEDFKILGVIFDVELTMHSAVDKLVTEASWKLKMLLRTRRFYTNAELVLLYKSHLLAFLEYRTPAIYHATREILKRLDRIQSKFLEDAGVTEIDALMTFNLAPLAARRDIAMMGLLHRTVIGKGPPHFRKHFQVEAGRRLKDPRVDLKSPLVKKSVLGLAAVYNMLPDKCRKARNVTEFQSQLQGLLKQRMIDGCGDWQEAFSPRVPLARHPLKYC